MPRKEVSKEILGLNRITKKRILELCKKDKLYQTPELNDVLYLHYQGFECIECLEDYTELKCLWLECNAISEIQGLDKLTKLKCLFLQSNLIRKIENLEFCKELDTINLSQNHIRKIENCGFEVLPVLNTLNLSSNYIKDCEGLKELEYCKTLSVLDLSNNRIDDILVVKIFARMPELKVLVLQGNPVVSKIPQYRKTLILECKKLTYLDSRPVFPKDRACAEAWKRGGYEEERKENERWNRIERKKMRDGVNATIQLRNKNRKPEDQLSLIPSSDSEDDTRSQKKNRKICMESDTSIDCIWNEVSEDKKSKGSLISDISSDSETSESYQSSENSNNGDIVDFVLGDNKDSESIKDPQALEKEKEQEIPGQDKQQKTFDGVVEGVDSLIENNIKDYDDSINDPQTLEQKDKQEIPKQKKQLGTFERKLNIQEIEMSSSPSSIVFPEKSEPFIKTIGTPPESSFKNCTDSEEGTASYIHDSDVDSQEQYKPIIEAIENIISENTLELSTRKLDKNLNKNEKIEEDNYEPLKELEETMNTLKKQETDENTFSQLQTIKEIRKPLSPRSQMKNEEECLKINSQLKTDFEELSTNLNAFVEQLDKEQGERQEVIRALFNNNIAAKESSCESSGKEESVCLEDWKFERMVDQWDEGSKRKKSKVENDVSRLKLKDKEQMTVINTQEKKEKLTDSFESIPTNEIQICELDNFRKPFDTNANKVFSCLSATETFDYMPMDISLLTRRSNESMNSLERESKELKILLQKLEDENKDLFKDINAEKKQQRDEENQENKEKEFLKEKLLRRNESQSSDESFEKSKAAMDVDINNIQKEKDKSDVEEEKLLERNENQSLDENFENYKTIMEDNKKIQEEKKNAQEIPGEGMKKLLERSQNGENQSPDENYKKSKTNIEGDKKEIQRDKFNLNVVERDENNQEKSEWKDQEQIVYNILEELLKSLELKQNSYEFPKPIDCSKGPGFSPKETPPQQQQFSQSVPEFLESFNRFFKNIEIKNQVSQKSSLSEDKQQQKSLALNDLTKQPNLRQFNNDTLQYLDAQLEEIKRKQNKKVRLMVDRVYAQKDRYNDTLELVDGKLMVRNKDTNELGELPQATPEYSSESETEYDTAQSEEEENDNNIGFKCKKYLKEDQITRLPYKPTARKSSEDLITKVLIENNRKKTTQDSEEESNDEFYSLDAQDKPDLYNIDKEFFDKLTLDKLNISEIDENHIVQCARSYEELKHCLTVSKEERCLTEEENELLENMIERKCVKLNGSPKNLLETLKNSSELRKEEQLWLNKISLNPGETNNPENVKEKPNTLDLKSSIEKIQLFEYNTESNSENPSQKQLEEQSLCNEAEDYITMKQLFLKTLSEKRDNWQREKAPRNERKQKKKNHESFLGTERQSEEEKNEFENNIDFESGTANKKDKFKAQKEPVNLPEVYIEDAFPVNSAETKNEFSASNTIDSSQVVSGSDDIEVLEYNLEIIGCNDELVDTITVNAELHF